MSIPPLLSNTPPPINGHIEDEDDDDFGDFRTADLSYDDNENSSSSPSMENSPKHSQFSIPLDINSNKNERKVAEETVNENVLNVEIKSSNIDEIRVNNEINVMAIEKDCLKDEEKTLKCEENGIDIKNDEFGEFDAVIPTNNFTSCDKESENIQSLENKHEHLGPNDNFLTVQENSVSKDISCEKSIEIESNDHDLQLETNIEQPKDEFLKENRTNCNLNDDFDDFQDFSSFDHKDFPKHNEESFIDKTELKNLHLENESLENQFDEFQIGNPTEKNDEDSERKTGDFSDNNEMASSENYLDCLNFDSNSTQDIENIIEEDDEIIETKSIDENVEISCEKPESSKLETGSANVEEINNKTTKLQLEIDEKSLKEPEHKKIEEVIGNDDDDDDFGDFADFASSSTAAPAKSSDSTNDFGDFAHFDDIPPPPTILLDSKDAKIKAETILKEIFPLPETISENEQVFPNLVENDEIFNKLKDITETPALKYQWTDSATQKQFLKALNIDTRNILYGPAWNPSMPRFAANLGVTLEPVKAEILTPTPVQPQLPIAEVDTSQMPERSSKIHVEDIPKADFDWSSSGLVNPLEEPPLNEGIDKPNQMEFISSTEAYNPKQLDLSTLETKTFTSSSKPLATSETPSISSDLDDIFGLTAPSPKPTIDLPNLVPLRETHISNNNSDNNQKRTFDLDWLDPLPETKIDCKEPTDGKLDSIPKLGTGNSQLDQLAKVKPKVEKVDFDSKIGLETSKVEDDFDDFQSVLPQNEIKPPLDLKKVDISPEPIKSLNDLPKEVKTTETAVDDDEFTDFYSSAPPTIVPQTTAAPLQPQAILEPLKPAVVHNNISQSAQINWPDPGLTDDDIKHIELSFAQPLTPPNVNQSPSKAEPKPNAKFPAQNDRKNSKDDDEWSDFVSVAKPSPKRVIDLNERSSTPDLPLSVLNLSSLQSPKKSIPVITPQGLMQTKLTSNFGSASGGSFRSDSKTAKGSGEDDDWSDFVSSPAVNTFWPTAVAKQETMSVVRNAKTSGSAKVVVQSKRSTIPSISEMPDLDFSGLKRTSHRK